MNGGSCTRQHGMRRCRGTVGGLRCAGQHSNAPRPSPLPHPFPAGPWTRSASARCRWCSPACCSECTTQCRSHRAAALGRQGCRCWLQMPAGCIHAPLPPPTPPTPRLRSDYGGKLRFSGKVSTVRCYENNPLVRKVVGLAQGAGQGPLCRTLYDGGLGLLVRVLGSRAAGAAGRLFAGTHHMCTYAHPAPD